MTLKNVTAYMVLVENALGWKPPAGRGSPRYNVEVKRVKEAMAADPLLSLDNLELTVELLRRERKPRSPLGVFAHVKRAVDMRREDTDDLEVAIWEAMSYEIARGDPAGWSTRFARAQGSYREEVLNEWKAAVK